MDDYDYKGQVQKFYLDRLAERVENPSNDPFYKIIINDPYYQRKWEPGTEFDMSIEDYSKGLETWKEDAQRRHDRIKDHISRGWKFESFYWIGTYTKGGLTVISDPQRKNYHAYDRDCGHLSVKWLNIRRFCIFDEMIDEESYLKCKICHKYYKKSKFEGFYGLGEECYNCRIGDRLKREKEEKEALRIEKEKERKEKARLVRIEKIKTRNVLAVLNTIRSKQNEE